MKGCVTVAIKDTFAGLVVGMKDEGGVTELHQKSISIPMAAVENDGNCRRRRRPLQISKSFRFDSASPHAIGQQKPMGECQVYFKQDNSNNTRTRGSCEGGGVKQLTYLHRRRRQQWLAPPLPPTSPNSLCLSPSCSSYHFSTPSPVCTMGRSRREHAVALTKTRKHTIGREKKQGVIEEIRTELDNYSRVYVFTTSNMRNAALKDLRALWRDSRWHFGRKRILQVALGRSPAEEYLENLHKVSEWLRGDVGLLLTNRSHDDVLKFFKTYAVDDFARSGFVATETVALSEGPLEQFAPAQVPNLQLIGLPVALKKGVVSLLQDFTICEEGDTLTPERAKMLELLELKMAKFSITLIANYEKDDGKFGILHAAAAPDAVMV